jgi:hypothetical protein
MLCKRCRSAHMEDNKIGFTFLRVSCDFTNFPSNWTYGQKKQESILLGTLERFESSQNSPLPSQLCPYDGGELAGDGTWPRTQTNEMDVRSSSRGVDWRRWFGRRSTRRWPPARQRHLLRCGLDSGEMQGGARPYVRVGGHVRAREEL